MSLAVNANMPQLIILANSYGLDHDGLLWVRMFSFMPKMPFCDTRNITKDGGWMTSNMEFLAMSHLAACY